ncbi:MAG: hypothetical protein LBR11_00085 [Deltaproteobacteria bacterium]|jgi:hypothetical protein|nr:hypothetical protein [Deltaproteobacteria bacterium]
MDKVKSPRPGKFLAWLQKAWRLAGHLDLAVLICLFLALDTALAYPLIQKSLSTFIPLGEVGLLTWLTTYGRFNLSHTFWFYGLMLGVTLLGINAFCCSTARVWAIVGPGRQRGWLYKLGPHLTHYAVVVMALGYLGSYVFSQALPGRALIPDGPPLKLPRNLGTLAVSVHDPVVYEGERLSFFQNWYLDPGFRLKLTSPEGQVTYLKVAYNRPAHYGGYNFYLADFYPKSAEPAGSYKMVSLSIRRDPASRIYLAGMAIFAVGLLLWLVDLRKASRLKKLVV